MHDIRKIRENPKKFDKGLKRRLEKPCAKQILQLDTERRSKILEAEKAQAEKNEASALIKLAKINKETEKFEKLRSLVSQKKLEISRLEAEAKEADNKLKDQLLKIPNIPTATVPDGKSELDNIEIKNWGEKRNFNFKAKEHFDVSGAIGLNFKDAAKISGSRFVILENSMAALHRALGQLMINTHLTKHGLSEIWTPVLVNSQSMLGTGQLPKFSTDSYSTNRDHWLIPTSEVSLTNMFSETILDEQELPKRLTCLSQCFRSEAGSAGRDTAGMLRQHQFEKVEMVSITKPEQSLFELNRMTECAQNILEVLNLPYRTMLLSSGDIGFSAAQTHDIEVWLPGQQKYREISSCSTCGDFQARRMNARYRPSNGSKPEYLHTLNGSGLAVGRCLIAVIENFQEKDGSINIPNPLKPYLNNASKIGATGEFQ